MARPCGHIKEHDSLPGWQELPKGLKQRGGGKGVAAHNGHDGSQNMPHTMCSSYNVPQTPYPEVNLRACDCGRNGTVCDSKARLEKAAQLWSGVLQLPHTLEASPSTQPPCCEEAQGSLHVGEPHGDTHVRETEASSQQPTARRPVGGRAFR